MKHLIVIPAYNEEEALPRTLADLQSLPDGFEVLIVNDGSTDRTAAVAQEVARTSRLPVHVVSLPGNGGIGVAVQTGYLFAAQRGGYTCVIQFDADGQHDAAYLPALVDRCVRDDLDLCVGSRFLEGSQKPSEKPGFSADPGDQKPGFFEKPAFSPPQADGFRSTFARRLGIRFFAGLIGLLSGTRVTDPTSGFRCAGPRAWASFARHYPEDYPEPESLFWCARNKLHVGELPVRMRERQGGVSSIRYLRSAYYMLKVSLSIVFDRLRAAERV